MTPRSRVLRIAAAGAAAALVLTTSACAQTIAGSGNRLGAAPSAAGSGAPGRLADPAVSADDLARKLFAGSVSGTTVHLSMASTGDDTDQTFELDGDVRTLDGGATDAFSFTVGVEGTEISLLFVDGTAYVQLPAELRSDPGKPWTVVTANPSNLALVPMAEAFEQFKSQASLAQYATFARTATGFRSTGPTEVDGTPGQGYEFEFDASAIPDAAASSVGTIPTTMVIDEFGRPLRVVQEITFEGTITTMTQTFSDYDVPVTIAAPPADQVSED